MSCTIRKATPWDLPRIREIYEMARQFMRKNGNHSQWGKGDEPEALIEEDICQGNLYVLEEADIHAVFCLYYRRRSDLSGDMKKETGSQRNLMLPCIV